MENTYFIKTLTIRVIYFFLFKARHSFFLRYTQWQYSEIIKMKKKKKILDSGRVLFSFKKTCRNVGVMMERVGENNDVIIICYEYGLLRPPLC